MKRLLTSTLALLLVGSTLSGCVVLDRHGRVDPGRTAVANTLLIGAGVVGLGIAASESRRHHYHEEVIVERRCGRCVKYGISRCRIHRCGH